MRVPILLLCSAFIFQGASADILSDADREALLESLEKLRENANEKIDGRFRLALAAYRSAMGSDDAAIEFYLNCMEKVNFEGRQRKPSDFREWKRRESEKLSDPGLRLALRHQLRWLILTLQAASEKADRARLATDASEILDAIFRDPARLDGQQEILEQVVTATVFARAYEINGVKVEDWPLSPVALDEIYEDVILPPHRRPGGSAGLRAAWIKRIQQESAIREHWTGDGGGQRRAGATTTASPAYTRFIEETLPKLQWDMEVDLFRHGDESGAAVRMLAHLERYIAHPSAREWSDRFKLLLKPETVLAPTETDAEAAQ